MNRMGGAKADQLFRLGSGLVAAAVPAVLFAIGVFLLIDGLPALRFMGLHFFSTLIWSTGNEYGGALVVRGGVKAMAGATFGVLPYILGTLLTAVVALVIALPLGVGAALFLSEWAPRRLEPVLSSLVELLAGVPSVVYGLWGLAVVVPAISGSVGPWLAAKLSFAPFFAGPVGTGLGLLTTSLVLAIMILPLIAATSRDAMRSAPRTLREGAVALGLTDWETIRAVVLPHARTAIVGSGILGLGRALGETMAVLMLSGGAVNQLPSNLYGPINTLAALVASQLDGAFTDPTGMAVHALAAAALTLFVISLFVNALARLLAKEEAVS